MQFSYAIELIEFSQKSAQFYEHLSHKVSKSSKVFHLHQPGVDYFFGGELSQKVRKLKFYGNSLVTFLEVVLHHLCREYGMTGEQVLFCLRQFNVTADFFEICELYEEVDCDARMTK